MIGVTVALLVVVLVAMFIAIDHDADALAQDFIHYSLGQLKEKEDETWYYPAAHRTKSELGKVLYFPTRTR